MAREHTPSTKEGALLRVARQRLRPKLSMGDAAEQAGITADYWGHIERGYQSMGKDQPPREVIAPASTLAHMARAAKLTPEELAEAGRTDAADFLRDLLRQDSAEVALPLVPNEARQAVADLKELARVESRSLAQLLLEAGLADEGDLVIPDALPKDRHIAAIEAEDIPDEVKQRLIKKYLERRAEIFEAERLRAERRRRDRERRQPGE
ncbi:helix-turn-helix domain-containing protein [Nonomuraea typhae]|uniref:helix-turn-helix domain-containing protein n=1 Tax=Nonomuraea typhae TaxID=2603600 RepID=UPI0012FA5D9E|nr:helix-turn-helix domain-containing protein [Nonomuraea typhae]